MAINLRLTPQKPTFQTQNPVENIMRNPVEDFLAPFKQQKSEMEQKLSELSSGQTPKSISQEINESNWSQFQGNDPSKPNYQPQSLIDYFRTGKTTSQLMEEGAIPSTTVPDSQNPFKTPTKSSNPYEGAPSFVQGVGNFMFGTNPDDPTTSGLYKTAEAIHGAGTSLFKNQVEGGKQIAELAMQHSDEALNRGYSDVSPEKEQKIKQYIREKLNAGVSPEIIKEALTKAKNEGKLRGSWWDNPISGTLATIESGLAKGIAGLETGISNLGSAPLQEDATAGVTRFAKGALETGLGSAQLATSIMPTTTGAKALVAPAVNTLFSTETAGKVMEPITETLKTGVAMGQEALGFNPESSVSKDIQDIGGTAGTIALFAGAQKAGSKGYDYIAPKVEGAVKTGVQKVRDVSQNIKAPTLPKTSKENVTGVTEGGVEFTIENTPSLGKNITDPLFKKPNEVLAQQSVFPKATKEKTIGMRKQASETALKGIKQLYEDKAKGIVESDIRTMGGGVEGVSEALSYHGKKIGELTKGESIVDTSDIITPLKESLSTPFSGVNPGMKNLVETIVREFDAVGNKASIEQIQSALSSIKSEIFANAENIAKLHKTPTGKALNDFLKNLEDRLNTTIENTSGNSAELQSAKAQYSALKKIEKDLADSYMVELRNQGKGITGTAGKIAGLYEVLSNPSMSGILKAIALKQAGETMQYYKSRSGNYETLIRNLDRDAMNRTPNPTKNDGNTSSPRGNMDNKRPLALPRRTQTQPEPIITPQTKEKAIIQE